MADVFDKHVFEISFDFDNFNALIKDLERAHENFDRDSLARVITKLKTGRKEEIQASTIDPDYDWDKAGELLWNETKSSVSLDHGDVRTICESDLKEKN